MLRSTIALLGGLASFVGVRSAQVTLGNTTLVGTDIPAFQQEFFAGIPFAEPPVGKLRLSPPVPKYSLNAGTFNATKYGPICIQPNATLSTLSEDCLTINVLRTAGTPANASLPVMLWVYGGGFYAGAAPTYNGSFIVAQSALRGTPVIYVNFNYRLGPLGFPQGVEAEKKGILNLGLKDQAVAFDWVQKNIAAFGGDPKKVTIFGESAGAISIAIHMLSPNFTQYARAAILESGSAATTLTNFAYARQKPWDAFAAAVPGCSGSVANSTTVDCIRNANLNTTSLLYPWAPAFAASNEQFPFCPTLDGPNGIFRSLPSLVLASGSYAKVPFIAGTNKDEGTAFISAPQLVTGQDSVLAALKANFTPSLIPYFGDGLLNSSAEHLLQLYADPSLGSPFGTGNETFGLNPAVKQQAALITDLSFVSQRRQLSQAAASQGIKTYGYLFTDPQPADPAYLGVTHGREVVYVFGATAVSTSNTTTPAAKLLSLNMVNYWISFATSLDPNDGKGNNRTAWPQFTTDSQVLLQLEGTNTTVIPDDFRKEQVDYINKNSVVFHHRRSA